MYPELTIVKLFLKQCEWEKHSKYLTPKDFPEELQFVYRVIDNWHKTSETPTDLSVADLGNLLYTPHPKQQEFNSSIVETLSKLECNDNVTTELINKVKQGKVFRELSLIAYDAAEGKAKLEDVEKVVDQLDIKFEEETDAFVEGSLTELIERTYKQPGLRWRLKCLNEALGSLRKGDFGFVFARPETGKTTFLCDQVSYMAGQAEGPVLWFNNEEQGDKVKLRVYQAALGCDLTQLSVNPQEKEQQFLTQTGNRVKILDKASISKWEVEQLCKKYKPSLIIFDQIDKITGFKADREDLMLGSIYIWARELAKQYAPVIAVCQAGGTGENVKYLTMNHVSNAHTAKQAEADWILGIGFIHDTGWENIRFLNISKNKLQGDVDTDPKKRHAKMEVLINPEIARYSDFIKS